MFLKVLNGFSQAVIIVLALVLIITITTKHSSNVALEDFQKQVEERFDFEKKNYEDKIKIVENSLNRYQQLRESRAQLYAKRLDELYDLYKKDTTPITSANSSPAKIVADTTVPKESTIDKNFSYFESKVNNLSEKVDNMDNKLNARLSVLEQRVEVIQKDNRSGLKVVQTNINNNSVGPVAK